MLTLCLATALAFAMFSIYGGQLWWPRRCNATPGATAAAGSKEVCSVLESTSEGHSLPSIVSSRLEGTPSHEIGTPMTSGDILTEVSEVREGKGGRVVGSTQQIQLSSGQDPLLRGGVAEWLALSMGMLCG